ncbi:MAG TPA: hypothetical protein VF701_20645 [Thermoanaerobaculia bacterium]
MKNRSLLFVLVLISAVLLVVSCGGREKPEGETWLGQSTETAPTGTQPDVAAGTTIIVMLQDGAIAVREEAVPPGPIVFTIENRGTEVHNIFLEGPGVQRAADRSVAPNETTSLDATLAEGSYVMYCPMLDHREKGEEVTINVAR